MPPLILSIMGQKNPRWVDKPEFAWRPDPPLAANGSSPRNNRTLYAPSFIARLAIGLGQFLILLLLLFGRAHGWWPDNAIVAGLILSWAFAPLLLVDGLARIPPPALLLWALFAGICLCGLGAYQHWRTEGADPGRSGVVLVGMVAILLFIGQAMILSHFRRVTGPFRYVALYEESWNLAIKVGAAGFAALLLPPGSDGLHPVLAILPVIVVLVLGVQHPSLRLIGRIRRGLSLVLTAALPALIFLCLLTVLIWLLRDWRASFGLCAAEALLLLLAINASYRGGDEWRPRWRRALEFTAALLLLPLAGLCAVTLGARVAQFGFTEDRVVALAALLLLSAYALAYAGAALISLGGGRWMARLESANLMMGIVALTLISAMASPLADPVRLSVANQSWRLSHDEAMPGTFDFAFLRARGLRYGQDALKALSPRFYAIPPLRRLAEP